MKTNFSKRYYNDLDAYKPEWWAMESLVQLRKNLVIASLVNRDWMKEFQGGRGEVVNISKPSTFTANRLAIAGSVQVQSAVTTKIQVKLDQHLEVTFLLTDHELQQAAQDLVRLHIEPAMRAVAEGIDSSVVGTYAQFFENTVGRLGTALTKATVISGEKQANDQFIPVTQRWLLLNTAGKADILSIAEFSKADEWGSTERQKQAALGELEGFFMAMTQTMPNTETSSTGTKNDTGPGAIDLAAGYGIGATAIVVDGYTGDPTAGEWVTVAGDDTPQQLSVVGGQTPTTTATLYPGLHAAVADDALITTWEHAKVNLGAGYVINYDGEIVVDNVTGLLAVGQGISVGLGSSAVLYSIIKVTASGGNTIGITLDRPIEAALADDAVLGVFPSGSYNLMFHPYGISLVTRPLDLAPSGMGVMQSVVDYDGIGLRVSMSYDTDQLGWKITIDALMGVKVVDTDYGVLFLN